MKVFSIAEYEVPEFNPYLQVAATEVCSERVVDVVFDGKDDEGCPPERTGPSSGVATLTVTASDVIELPEVFSPTATILCEPVTDDESHEYVNGADVILLPKLFPSSLNCTDEILFETEVDIVTVPDTVPDDGDVIERLELTGHPLEPSAQRLCASLDARALPYTLRSSIEPLKLLEH